MTVDDQEHIEKLRRGLAQVDDWRARIDPGAPRPAPASRSAMAGDDARTDPFQTSHAAWHAIVHAVDHLHCLRALIEDAELLTMYAPYTLVRAALENAAAAVWLLLPANRGLRITRRLRMVALDVHSAAKVAETMGRPMSPSREERFDRLRAVAAAAGVDPGMAVRRPGYEEIVRDAGPVLGVSVLPVVAWRACSGIAHGDLWATLTLTTRAALPQVDPNVATMSIAISPESLWYMTSVAIGLTRQAWALYDQRSTAPY